MPETTYFSFLEIQDMKRGSLYEEEEGGGVILKYIDKE